MYISKSAALIIIQSILRRVPFRKGTDGEKGRRSVLSEAYYTRGERLYTQSYLRKAFRGSDANRVMYVRSGCLLFFFISCKVDFRPLPPLQPLHNAMSNQKNNRRGDRQYRLFALHD